MVPDFLPLVHIIRAFVDFGKLVCTQYTSKVEPKELTVVDLGHHPYIEFVTCHKDTGRASLAIHFVGKVATCGSIGDGRKHPFVM